MKYFRRMEWMFGIVSLYKKKMDAAMTVLFLAFVPILCALLYCLWERQRFSQIYLPASSWNDELLYYKLTESVLAYGYPQGYFGFNESHGLYLSFAAWSPVLLLFWIIWGFFFGWNLLSPMLCNIALLSLSMLLFALLVKPDKKQSLLIGMLYAAFIPITRFALSCIPEAELFALFIVFLGVAISCKRMYRGWMIGVMSVLVMLMTWMRPYLILLFITPAVLLFYQKGKKAFFPMGGIVAFTLAVYVAIHHFFSAPYLTDLFYTEWITVYFEQGLLAGLRYTVWKLYTSLGSVANMIGENLTVKSGLISAAGLYYFIFLLLLFLLLVKISYRISRKNWEDFLLEGQMLLCMVGFFVADLLMYRLQEGGRHTLVYIVGCLFLLPFSEGEFKKKQMAAALGMAAAFLFIFGVRGNIPYEFTVPYGNEEHRADLENMAEQLAKNMELAKGAPNYDNTVIWTVWDSIDGKTKTVDFGAYYAVPIGFGINSCDGGYMDVNLERLQSRYIGVIPGGDFEKRCLAAGGKVVGECKRLVVYDMYDTRVERAMLRRVVCKAHTRKQSLTFMTRQT